MQEAFAENNILPPAILYRDLDNLRPGAFPVQRMKTARVALLTEVCCVVAVIASELVDDP